MLTSHPFRFGVVAAIARTGDEWVTRARRVESLVLKAVLAGQAATAAGLHYAVTNAEISPRPVQQPHPPILIDELMEAFAPVVERLAGR